MSEKKLKNSPVLIDNPEAYTSRDTLGHSRLTTVDEFEERSKSYTAPQVALVNREARLFGIDPSVNPGSFVEAHATFVADAEQDLQERLPRVKSEVVDRIANYFGKGDEDRVASLKELMIRRLEATTEVGVYDSLAYAKDVGGFYSLLSRRPQLTIYELALALETSDDQEEYSRKIEEVTLAHEVMHGVLTSGTQNTAFNEHWPIRNGLSVWDYSNTNDFMGNKITTHGEWVNEATLESFRREIFETEDVRYEPGVMIIETLDELSNGLRDELVLAALDSAGPGATFGKIELLLGPTGIEDVGELIAKVSKVEDLLAFREAVVQMLPKELRSKAAEILIKKEVEFLGNSPRYKEVMAELAKPLVEAAIAGPLK
jgi:hypothetical protein